MNMKKTAILVIAGLVLIGVVGCKPKPGPTALELQEELKQPKKTVVGLDIGDVEVGIRIEAKLPEPPSSDSITEQQMRNQRNRLDFNTITLSKPYPTELNIKFAVSTMALPEDVVALRVKIYREKEEIGSFSKVLTGESCIFDHIIDVFQGLNKIPDTMLIHTRGEVILLPKGTDPSTVDPETVTGTEDTTGAVASNPIRINTGEVEDL